MVPDAHGDEQVHEKLVRRAVEIDLAGLVLDDDADLAAAEKEQVLRAVGAPHVVKNDSVGGPNAAFEQGA